MEIQGAFSAIITPFTSDGASINERELRSLVDRTIDAGADGIVACGGTGEFIALSFEERQQVVSIVTEQTDGRVAVFAQTGGLSTREALRHTKHAEAAGVTGVMVAPPFYEALSHEAAVEYFSAVAQSTTLPVMLYNYPHGTGLTMDAEFIADLARSHDNIRYVKDSSADALLLSNLVTNYASEIGTFCGEDVLVGAAVILGVRGLVTGSFNFMMPIHAEMMRAQRAGDDATVLRIWRETLPLVVCLATNPYTSGVKAACEILGHNVGQVRDPLPRISPSGRNDLERHIQSLPAAYFA